MKQKRNFKFSQMQNVVIKDSQRMAVPKYQTHHCVIIYYLLSSSQGKEHSRAQFCVNPRWEDGLYHKQQVEA